MTKPDVTLQPSKATLAQASAQIYAAYLSCGKVPEGAEEEYIKRSIREAITIASTIDASVHSDGELPADETEQVRVPVPKS